MGTRKRKTAESRKELLKNITFAKLNKCPTSTRKMRLVADMIRGLDVDNAMHILNLSSKEASEKMHKLLRSALANWQAKNVGTRIENADLYIKEVFVDGGTILSRSRSTPQGRASKVRKRSNHVTLFIGSRLDDGAKDTNIDNKED